MLYRSIIRPTSTAMSEQNVVAMSSDNTPQVCKSCHPTEQWNNVRDDMRRM